MPRPAYTLNSLQVAKANWARLVQKTRSRHTLPGILLLGFLIGTLCFLLVPPWLHYDEPGHFEYAWLAVHSPHWPVEGQSDQAMRREMAASMLDSRWYAIRGIKVDLNSSPIPIGVVQVGDQPGYYFLVSLPLRFLASAPIVVQYDAARLVSLLLFLLIIVVTWYALGEILPDKHPLRWMATVFVAVLPAFVDEMVSVNNDVSAVLAASLFIWASLRLIQKGYSLPNVLCLAGSLVACYLSKATAYYAFALAPITLLLTWLRGRFTAYLYVAAAILLVGFAVAAFQWGGPSAWYARTIGNEAVRVESADAPLGRYAFRLSDNGATGANLLMQIVPPDQAKALRGRTVTLGAWMWARQDGLAEPPTIRFQTAAGPVQSPQLVLKVTTKPAFHVLSFSVPDDLTAANVYVQEGGAGPTDNTIFFDGLVLAAGQFGSDPPQFTDASGTHGVWTGRQFTNLLRNPSGEQAGLQLRKWVIERTSGPLTGTGINPALALMSLQDWKGTGWYYRAVASTLFRTFWASLAADHVVPQGPFVNDLLVVLTILGVVGAAVLLWRRRRTVRWDLIGFLALALSLPWALAAFRGTATFLIDRRYLYPWARYAYPGILPTALLLCAGWFGWLELLSSRVKLPAAIRDSIFFGVLTGISFYALLNAVQEFRPASRVGPISLVMLFVVQLAAFYLVARWSSRQASTEVRAE